jgi:leucyl/phenylalanyl-tRNA--protein transferase
VNSATIAWDEIFNPKRADKNGLVAVGGEWGFEILIEAYSRGCFPWPEQGLPILWFSPLQRGIVEFSEVRINRSLKRLLSSHKWKITFNQAFSAVMQGCAEAIRPGQSGTWILPEMIKPYTELFYAGHGLSCEIWHENGDLVGGLYGVLSERYFSAESMFYKESGASKVAFIETIRYLKREKGFHWMDIQMLTSVTESLGGKLISQNEFLQRISR